MDPQPHVTTSEYRLVSAGPGAYAHNIMRLTGSQSDLRALRRPVRMFRKDAYGIRIDKMRKQAELRGDPPRDQAPAVGPDGAPLPPGSAPAGAPGLPLRRGRKKKEKFKKKTKAYFFSRSHDTSMGDGRNGEGGDKDMDGRRGGGDDDDDDDLADTDSDIDGLNRTVASVNSRLANPDKKPWVLEDDEGRRFIGERDSTQSSSYVLFVRAEDGFRVVPAAKWYNFTQQVQYRILTMEEAEEQIKSKSTRSMPTTSNRWLMKGAAHDGENDSESKLSLLQRLRKFPADGPGPSGRSMGASGRPQPKSSRRSGRENDDVEAEDGLDYEEEFADDEEVVLGIEDTEEAKEARRRLVGRVKATYEDDDFGEEIAASYANISKSAKKIAKTLVKHDLDGKKEENDFDVDNVYNELDEENPYVSEEDDDDEDEDMDDVEGDAESDAQQKAAASDLVSLIQGNVEAAKSAAKKDGAVPSRQPQLPTMRKQTSTLTSSSQNGSNNASRSQSPAPDRVGSPEINKKPKSKAAVATSSSSPSSPPPGSPAPASPAPGSPQLISQDAKRKRSTSNEDIHGDAEKRPRQQSPPPPPSSAEVLAQMARANKARAISSSSLSTSSSSSSSQLQASGRVSPPSQPSPSASNAPSMSLSSSSSSVAAAASSPPSSSTANTGGRLLTETDIIRTIKSFNRPVQAKEIVLHLKPILQTNPKNRDLIRDLLRKLANRDKDGNITLKEEYRK